MSLNPFTRRATPNRGETGADARPTTRPFVTPATPAEVYAKAAAPTADEPDDEPDDGGNDPREVGKPDPAEPLATPSPVTDDDARAYDDEPEHVRAVANERAANLTGWRGSKRRRRFTNDEVEEIRTEYARRRTYVTEVGLDADGAEGWQTITDTVRQLATEYGVGAETINRMVLGVSYQNAPGPIDTARLARHEQYRADKAELGEAVARSRLATRTPATAEAPGVVTITVTRPGEKARVFRYPLGTEVTVGYDGAVPEADK